MLISLSIAVIALFFIASYLAFRWARTSTEVARLMERNRSLEALSQKGSGDFAALKEEMKSTFESLASNTLKGVIKNY